MSEWQPIETAPKNGTPFLAYYPKARWVPLAKPVIVSVLYNKDWGNFVECSGFYYDQNGDLGDLIATHWMPLPTPPENDN